MVSVGDGHVVLVEGSESVEASYGDEVWTVATADDGVTWSSLEVVRGLGDGYGSTLVDLGNALAVVAVDFRGVRTVHRASPHAPWHPQQPMQGRGPLHTAIANGPEQLRLFQSEGLSVLGRYAQLDRQDVLALETPHGIPSRMVLASTVASTRSTSTPLFETRVTTGRSTSIIGCRNYPWFSGTYTIDWIGDVGIGCCTCGEYHKRARAFDLTHYPLHQRWSRGHELGLEAEPVAPAAVPWPLRRSPAGTTGPSLLTGTTALSTAATKAITTTFTSTTASATHRSEPARTPTPSSCRRRATYSTGRACRSTGGGGR